MFDKIRFYFLTTSPTMIESIIVIIAGAIFLGLTLVAN